MRGDVAQQPAHADPGREERDHEPHGEDWRIAGVQQGAFLVQGVDAGTDQRGDGEEEAEIGGHLPRQPPGPCE